MRLPSRAAVIAASITAGAALALVGGPVAAGIEDPTPASYINPDTGMPTENVDVDPGSECETPDQTDTQALGDELTGAGNVHNDACLFDAQGGDVDTQVAFESAGVGVISACPDPDGDGAKTATNSADRTRCVQTGFEAGGANGPAGDGEYHIRLVSAAAGSQTVTFCADPEGDGCANASSTDEITITWTDAPPVTMPPTGLDVRSVGTGVAGIALVGIGGAFLVLARRRTA